MRWMTLGVLLGSLACARRVAAPVVAPGALVDFMTLIPSNTDSGVVAQRRAAAQREASLAGSRIVSIEVTPQRLEVTAGDELRLLRALRIVGRDSAGRVVNGWAPYYLLSDGGMARLHESGLIAVLPGTVEVFVRVTVSRDSAGRLYAPLNQVSASTFVTVRERPYTRPDRPPSSPRAVLDAYVAAAAAEQWADAARYLDLERFALFVNSRVAAARPRSPRPEMTLEQFLQAYERQPNAPPRAVLEWQFQQRQRAVLVQPDPGDISVEFAGVTTLQELAALPAESAAARWLEATDPRTQARASARRSNCDSIATRLMVGTATNHVRPISVVPYNDSIAWGFVAPIVWSPFQGTDRAPTSILLRRNPGGAWRVDLRPDVRGGSYGASCPVTQRSR